MKKIKIFLLIFFAFSIFICFPNTKAKADGTYNIKISTDAIYSDETDLANYTFVANYEDNEYITFIATLYEGEIESSISNLNYEWSEITSSQDENGIVVSSSKNFVLDKIYNNDQQADLNLMKVGEKKYRVKITGDAVNCLVELSVRIDDSTGQIISTKLSRPLPTNTNGEYVLSNKSSYLTISAILCKPSVDHTINWYYKTPNSCSFDLYKENGDCNINPTDLITSNNGFGNYYFYASAQTSSVLYTSKMIVFNTTAGEVNDTLNYSITKSVIANTKANVEAYTFKLENAAADGLDFNKILWYVNDQKVGKGETFSYEPTDTRPFIVKAQYQGANLIELAQMSTTPKSTGTLTMILYIVGAVVILSVIFAISLKIQNKKRDVVW